MVSIARGVDQLGATVVTVGQDGDFTTLTDAVAFVNGTTRYTTIYSTGTATLVNGSKKITPSGGADFTDSTITATANRKELWLYLDTADIFLPLQGMAPPLASGSPATSWGDYGELKYTYEGTGAAKSYELITPHWYHIHMLPGVIYDDTVVDWPQFCTLSGAGKESTIFQGSIHVDASRPGIWMRDFTWGPISGVAQATEEALITMDDTVQSAEVGYADLVMERIGGGSGNADRDVTYRSSNMISHAMFKSVDCEYFSHYDAVQCTARNMVFKNNDVYIHTQDTTIFDPTGLRWFSGAPAKVGADHYIDVSDNRFNVQGTAGARAAAGIILLGDNATYLSTSPNVYGQIVDNHISVHQDGTGNASGIITPTNSGLFAASSSRLLIDRNTFDVVSAGGTKRDLWTMDAAAPTKALCVWGKNNVTQDGSAFDITGYTLGVDPINALTGTASITQANANRKSYITGTAAATYTLPEATGSGDEYEFIIGQVNTNGTVFVVADTTNANFIGSVNNLDLDAAAQAAFGCPANCDTITLNGTTTGGQLGDIIRLVDVATDVWMVFGQLQCPTGSNSATPFSAAV